MRKIREVLRLLWSEKRSARSVAQSCRLSRGSVASYEQRAKLAGLSWPLPDLDDAELEALLFLPDAGKTPAAMLPDWHQVDLELRKHKHVTRQLLWMEYRAENPDGLGYTRFCELLREWHGLQDLSMRQTHVAGEKVFVDYAGSTIPIADPVTGEVKEASIFVAALGASHYSFAEATWTQALPDWLGSHVRMLEFYGGSPQIIIPDNTKTAVTKASWFEPDLNQSYVDFAQHYELAVIPTRSRKPKDKAVVESAVQVVGRWILARLRNMTFFSLEELNDAIRELLTELNAKPFQKRPGSRLSMFEMLDSPQLRALPAIRYQFAQWKKVRPHMDYHVKIDGHHYSVPHQLVGIQLDARITLMTIEIFHKGRRVASHHRVNRQHGHTTLREHMPENHQLAAGMTEPNLLDWAEGIGPETRAFIKEMMDRRPYPQQAFRSCAGVLNLAKTHSKRRLELACARANKLQAIQYASVKTMLEKNLESKPLTELTNSQEPIDHPNVRGSSYYN